MENRDSRGESSLKAVCRIVWLNPIHDNVASDTPRSGSICRRREPDSVVILQQIFLCFKVTQESLTLAMYAKAVSLNGASLAPVATCASSCSRTTYDTQQSSSYVLCDGHFVSFRLNDTSSTDFANAHQKGKMLPLLWSQSSNREGHRGTSLTARAHFWHVLSM